MTVRLRAAHDPAGLREAFAAIAAERPDGLYVELETALSRHSTLIVELVTAARLPAMYSHRRALDDGGLMAYGASIRESFASAAPLVDKILKGAKPGDLPVQAPTRFDFAINLKAAQAIGLTIPPSVLAQTTELIQ
jgi:putative ABC transport system substrate-binding protein